MKIFLAIASYILIVICFMQNLIVPAALITFFFSFTYGAGYLIPIAILIDGYYGNFYTVPYLSLFSVWWYLAVCHFRPKVINLHSA